MCDLTPERAGQIIDEIRLLNGVISDEERASTPAGVLRALDALRQNCAETISRLDPISGRLLIYQLISKATCLEYDRAKARREDPFIKFTLSKDGLIIDSNDNGYSEEDIRELCKPYPEQRLVLLLHHELFAAFQIGSKVSIQSAPFSLSFQYAVGDNKMDKITPKREDLMVLPPKVSLRISITGFHPGRFDELRDALRDIIRDGMYVFDSKGIHFYFTIVPVPQHPQPREQFHAHYKIDHQGDRMVVTILEKVLPRHCISLRKPDIREYYRVFKRTFDIRTAATASRRATIYLCFPIDQKSRALAHRGGLSSMYGHCGILPGFSVLNFMVCSADIDLFEGNWDASVPTEDKSKFLCDAMVFLSGLESMQYEWVQYIPRTNTVNKKILGYLYEHLKRSRIFRSEKGTKMPLSSLCYLRPEHCDRHGRPLFPDLTDETYLSIHGRPLFPDLKDETYLSILSTRYSPFLEFLKPLGVRQVSDLELLEQVKEFYRPLSCTFNPPQDNDWSSRVARLLTSWLEMKPDGVLATGVKELRLLLLSDGTKVRGVDCVPNEVWLSHDTNGNVVPAFPQVICRRDFKALDDASNRLYKSLGIHCPNHQEVMKRIDSQTHQLHDPSSSGYVLDMLLYIKTTATKIDKRQIHCLLMFDREFHKDLTPGANGLCRCQLQRDVYFPSNDPYSMSKIAERLNMISNIPAIHVLNEGLIHPTLLEERGIPSTEWVSWLENVALVRRVPRLQNRLDSTRLSDIFEAILKYCPTMFLGVLGTHWHEYKGGLEPEIISRIKETSVSTLSGDRMLRECYLSTRELRTIVIRILGSNLGSPFLLHQDAFSEKVRDKWGFLSIFGVLTDPTPAFFVELSKQLSQTVPLAKARSQFQELYDIISERNQDEIRTFFQETNVIYIPDENKSAKLVPLKSCVWDGPEWLQSSHRLRHIKEYFENRSIQFMLRTTLGIQDATLHTYIRELQHQQDLGLGWISQIERTYEHLAKMQMNEQDVTFVQDQFKQHKLVYNPKTSKWHTLEECIWAAPSDEDNIGITEYYPKLRELFVDRLLIEEPTVQSYVAKLERTAGKNTRTDQICSLIQRIINLSPSPSDLDPLSEVSFLPIEGMNQKHYYASPKDDFFIIDQDGWPSNFRGLVPTLRLTTKQIQEIRPFLDALALDNRFISVAGMKETLVLEEPKAGSQSLTFDFRDRAIPFCRCSVFYAGDKGKSPQELYDIFSTSVIYESLKIEARCTLRMSDGTNKSIGVPSKLHLQFENEELHIVVPSNGTQRKVCYATQLPAALAGLYASNSPVARGTFATILREPIEALDDILIDYGIPDLPELNIPDKLSIKTETGCTKTEVEDIFFTPSASLTSSLTNPSGLFSAVDSAPANLDILAVRLKNLLPPSGKDEERPA